MSDSIFDVINRRFVSGNSTCVERAHITQSEWAELTRLQSEVERLRGRVAELECAAKNAATSIIRTVNSTPKTILIKQAEAIEAWLHGTSEMGGLDDYAQRLRQQAKEIENAKTTDSI